jgi:hypothetical protein
MERRVWTLAGKFHRPKFLHCQLSRGGRLPSGYASLARCRRYLPLEPTLIKIIFCPKQMPAYYQTGSNWPPDASIQSVNGQTGNFLTKADLSLM